MTTLFIVIIVIIIYLCMIRLISMCNEDCVGYIVPLMLLFIVGFFLTLLLLTYNSLYSHHDDPIPREYSKEELTVKEEATSTDNSTPIIRHNIHSANKSGSFIISYKGVDSCISLNGRKASYVKDGIIILDDGSVYGNGDRLEDVAKLKDKYQLDTKNYYDYTSKSLIVIPIMPTEPSNEKSCQI